MGMRSPSSMRSHQPRGEWLLQCCHASVPAASRMRKRTRLTLAKLRAGRPRNGFQLPYIEIQSPPVGYPMAIRHESMVENDEQPWLPMMVHNAYHTKPHKMVNNDAQSWCLFLCVMLVPGS